MLVNATECNELSVDVRPNASIVGGDNKVGRDG
jgi:hypothetical protein